MTSAMKKDRQTSLTVGILILVAYSILGTNNPDAKALGVFLEIISGHAVIGIAVLMFPLLKPYGKNLAFSYLALKSIEGGLMIIAGIFFFIHTPFLLELRDTIYICHGYIFAIPALIVYYLLYESKLIPGWLSVWGIVASILLIVVNILEVTDIVPKLEILYLPIVLNELVLAIWLMVKGFTIHPRGLSRGEAQKVPEGSFYGESDESRYLHSVWRTRCASDPEYCKSSTQR